jgi:UDP-glucuronate 4-epimerase
VYGDRTDAPFREDDDIHRPVSPYAATKRAGELLAYTHHHLYGIPTTCLRFFTVYGPRQRPEMAIHKFVDAVHRGKPIPFYGDGSTRRDYTYVDDIVDGVLRALDRCEGYEIYNLGESQTTSLAELVRQIGEVTGIEPVLDRQPLQPGDVAMTCADVSKEETPRLRPRTSVRQGIGASWRGTARSGVRTARLSASLRSQRFQCRARIRRANEHVRVHEPHQPSSSRSLGVSGRRCR